ncbi:MAG: hypothetical protein ACOX6O_04580 [Christensenellales bacterium]|jgi:hypothetical protein
MKALRLPQVSLDIPGLKEIQMPRMARVRQRFDDSCLSDPTASLLTALENNLGEELKSSLTGQRICLGVGSRGIPEIRTLVKTLVSWLKAKGADPFIIPAMGSHGGATAKGQVDILAGLGLTQTSVGTEIRATMEAVPVAQVPGFGPVYCDRLALQADGIIVFNKIKPHSDFRGPHESGLAKMCTVGFGKHQGASAMHAQGFDRFCEMIPLVAEAFIANTPVLFALGVAENANGRLYDLQVMEKADILASDRAMLVTARSRMARIGFCDLDLLIIDEIGKNISGNGHDPNITGRAHSPGFENTVNAKRLFIRGLNPASQGNAAGLSLADITTRRVLEQVDLRSTWTNALTAGLPQDGRLPLYTENDREAIALCLLTAPGVLRDRPRVVRIKSTVDLGVIQASEALLSEAQGQEDLQILEASKPMLFDESGFLKA